MVLPWGTSNAGRGRRGWEGLLSLQHGEGRGAERQVTVKGSEGHGVDVLGCGECVLTCRKPVCLQLSGRGEKGRGLTVGHRDITSSWSHYQTNMIIRVILFSKKPLYPRKQQPRVTSF